MIIVGIAFGGLLLLLLFTLFFSLTPADRTALFGATQTIEVDERKRFYRVVAPKQVNSDTRLVMLLHGFSSNAMQMAYISGLHNVMTDSIVVYPDSVPASSSKGTKTGWNSGFCCGSGRDEGVDDVAFLKQLIEQVSEDYSLEKKSAVVAGFSNGGFMAQRFAIDAPEYVDALVLASSAIGTPSDSLRPVEGLPILIMHGADDKRIPIAGGASPADPDFNWLPQSEMIDRWTAVGAQIETETYPGDGHQWHDWRLFRVWHRTPAGSERAHEFIRTLED